MNILVLTDRPYYDCRIGRQVKSLMKYGDVFIGCSGIIEPVRKENIRGIYLLRYLFAPYCMDPLSHILWFIQIWKILKKKKFSLIYANDIQIGVSAFFLSRIFQIPFIFDNHELWFFRSRFLKSTNFFPEFACYFVSCFPFRIFESMIMRKSINICVSSSSSKWFFDNYHLKKPPHVVRNVVDLEEFDKRKNKDHFKQIKGVKILHTGNIQKGGHGDICDFLQGVSLLDTRLNFKVILMSSKDKVLKAVGPDLVKNLDNIIIFAGRMENWNIMPSIIRSADICIDTTIVNGFTTRTDPNRIYEYLAASTIVISTARKNIIDSFGGKKIIYWWNPRTPERIAEIITLIIDKLDSLDYRRQKGRHLIEKSHNWQNEIANFESIISRLLNNSSEIR